MGVDVGAKSEVYTILRNLRAAETAVLVVSSDMEEVMAISDPIMVMRTGLVGVLLIGFMSNGLGLLNVPIEMQLIAKGLIIIIALTISGRET